MQPRAVFLRWIGAASRYLSCVNVVWYNIWRECDAGAAKKFPAGKIARRVQHCLGRFFFLHTRLGTSAQWQKPFLARPGKMILLLCQTHPFPMPNRIQLVLHKYPSFSTQRGMKETSTLFFSKLGAESSFIFYSLSQRRPRPYLLKASGIIILPFFKSLNYEKTKQIAGK